jgi:hypothetical protein
VKIKLWSTLASTVVLAIVAGAGDTGRAPVDPPGPGEAVCSAIATTQFATPRARIDASAKARTTYCPGRTCPLCAYPAYARYSGSGSLEDGANFTCIAPQ